MNGQKGHIFCILGKSASGKDSLYKRILEEQPIELNTIVSYTTRPLRDGEQEGVEYHFTDYPTFKDMLDNGRVFEYRCYHTVYGDWYYFTADDGQISENRDYLITTVLGGYENLLRIFGKERVIPIYIEVEDGVRLMRAIAREQQQAEPKYTEMCRRFIADSADFSEENIERLHITKRYQNIDFEQCFREICEDLRSRW